MQNRIHSPAGQRLAIAIAVFVLLLGFRTIKAESLATITVTADLERPLDTLYLMKTEGGCVKRESIAPTFKAVAGENMRYHFEVPVKNPDDSFRLWRRIENDTTELIFKILAGNARKYLPVTARFYLSPDDDISISIKRARPGARLMAAHYKDYICTFSGKNSTRYTMEYKADSVMNRNMTTGRFDENLRYHQKTSPRKYLLDMLEDVRPQISDFHYRLIQTDIHFFDAGIVFKALAEYREVNRSSWSPESFRLAFSKMISDYFREEESGKSPHSQNYIRFLTGQASFESELALGNPDPGDVFDRIAIPLHGLLRDRTLVYYLSNNKLENAEALYDKAFTILADKSCIAELELSGIRFSHTKKVELSLPDASGNILHISDLSGKWIFTDFWFTGCGGCVAYYKQVIRHLEKEFADDPRIVFVSISADRHKASWIESVSKEIYSSPHALNLFTNGEGFEHELLKRYGIDLFPTVMLIDPDGYMAAFNTPGLAVRNGEKVARYIRDLMEQRGK